MVIRIVVARFTGAERVVERLRQSGALHVEPAGSTPLADALAGADALVCMSLRVEDTERAAGLRLVQTYSAGVDEIDPQALPPGCALCNAGGHARSIAEWVLMAMVALERRVLVRDRDLRRGLWFPDGTEPVAFELGGRVLGIVGLGAIAHEVAALARSFGMCVEAVTRSPSRARAAAAGVDRLAGMDALDELLRRSDVVLVAVPLTAQTRGLIDAQRLRLIGERGYLVNVARGPVVDEEALYEALRDGEIAGAALDVWWSYPARPEARARPSRCPFWQLDNVLLSPHVSAHTVEAEERRLAFLDEQLRRLARSEPLSNVVCVGESLRRAQHRVEERLHE